MENYGGKPALFTNPNPNTVLEATRELKANCPDEYKAFLQDVFGALTNRDLVFYTLGKVVGHRIAFTSVDPTFEDLFNQEKES